MKVFLDTTYLFPAIDVDITEGWTKSALKTLLQTDLHIFFYADLSLFEIYTKIMKLNLQQQLAIEMVSVQRGIQGILNSPKLHKLNWWENVFETEIVLQLRAIHSDSIDCMLFYLAVANCDIFATYDDAMIKAVKQSEDIRRFVLDTNPLFQVWLSNLSNSPRPLFT